MSIAPPPIMVLAIAFGIVSITAGLSVALFVASEFPRRPLLRHRRGAD